MDFIWSSGQNNEINMLLQHVQSKNGYNIVALYDGVKTKIEGAGSYGNISETFEGLKIIKITTNRGDLVWSY